MNILLIGGTGVLSSAVTEVAKRKGIRITMINRGSRKIPEGVELIKANCFDYEYVRKCLTGRKFDAIIDFLCYSDQQTTNSFNLYKDFTKQYFFISSCAVYDTRLGEICQEDSPKVLPMWSYSVEKWDSEQNLKKLAEASDVYYTIIRPCVTYGDTRIPYGISPQYGYHWTLVARILTGKPIIRWNGGVNRCNMTRVEDFAVGVVGLIGNPKAYNEAFNICGDETPTFNDVLDAMAEYLGKKPVLFDLTSEEYAREIPNRNGELLGGRSIDAINSNKKIKDAVPDFKQIISLKEGVRMTLDAYKSQDYQKGIDWNFDADTDRIISKYCKQKSIDAKHYNLEFIDYLGNANQKDKLTYWLEYHKTNPLVHVARKGINLCDRVLGKIKTLLHK